MKKYHADRIPSPFGDVWAVVDDDGALVRLDFEGGRSAPRDREDLEAWFEARGAFVQWNKARLRPVARQLNAYFRGKRTSFDLPVAPEGTPFQRKVWKALQRIPFGKTLSYGQLAKRVGSPGAARAVGRANATNPVSVVIPCHRVIGSNGSLTGYGGGMERKRGLLELEGAEL
jgi:methylated-DNA-[protein]-cysteine S-methyltransferase